MVFGYVKWFGGLNKKLTPPRVNNHGYIVVLEDSSIQEIKFYRDDISESLQKILEDQDSRGIYVQFDIDVDKAGRQKAIHIVLLDFVGEIVNKNILKPRKLSGTIRCDLKPIQNSIRNINFLSEGLYDRNKSLVYCNLCHDPQAYDSFRAIRVQNIDVLNCNRSILINCLNSHDLRKHFTMNDYILLAKRDLLLPQQKIEILLEKINRIIDSNSKYEAIHDLYDNFPDVFLTSPELRTKVIESATFKKYLLIIDENIDKVENELQSLLIQEVVSEIEKKGSLTQDQISSINSDKIIKACMDSNNPQIRLSFLGKHLKNLEECEFLETLQEKIVYLSQSDRKILIKTLDDKIITVFIESLETRNLLYNFCFDDYLKIFKKVLCDSKLAPELSDRFLNELLAKYQDSKDFKILLFLVKNVPSFVDKNLNEALLQEIISCLRTEKISFPQAQVIFNNINYFRELQAEYRGEFWDIMPDEQKRKVIFKKFSKFFQLIEEFNRSQYPDSFIREHWRKIHNKFDHNDKKLIQMWVEDLLQKEPKSSQKDVIQQMRSARGAEKLVFQFYTSLGYTVEDTSIYQVTKPSDQCWKLADIKIDNQYRLDVKNARKSVNSKVYSDFRVARFKRDRIRSVIIVGVLSPYIKDELAEEATKDVSSNFIKYLGEVGNKRLVSIDEIFGDFSKTEHFTFQISLSRDYDNNKYLPPWIFDYNVRFYAEQVSIINEFKQLHEQDIPIREDLVLVEKNIENIFPLFLASKRSLPDNWIKYIPQWQYQFMLSLIDLPSEKLCLPYLFLAILKHFLMMLSDDQSSSLDYNPLKYKDILYTSSSTIRPLKLYDPLNIINEFCDSLNSIWEFRHQANLTKFTIFKFNGKGLLTGQETEKSEPKRLLAYCGGRIEKLNNAKCGKTPLVIGKDKTCEFCYKLICPQCNYCNGNTEKKEYCKGYNIRKQLHELDGFSDYIIGESNF